MPAPGLEPVDSAVDTVGSESVLKVIAFTRYDRAAASTRQRLLQYLPALRAAGIVVQYEPLLDDEYVRILAEGGRYSRFDVLRAYFRRARRLLARSDADVVWVYGELFPFLPGWFERLALARRSAVVYDFDDAFFHNYDANRNPAIRLFLGRKLQPLLRRASACCCGNSYLESYASRFCRRTVILPTVVDSKAYRPRSEAVSPRRNLVIGWIGSPSTWRYMRPLLPLLREMAQSSGVKVRVVGAGSQAEADRFPGMELVDWSEEREVADVQAMDIGIMPLPNEMWAQGKSGYKLIQYMACGLPVIAAPVGVNRTIVKHGITGFLAETENEWLESLQLLLEDADLRRRMGRAGRARAESEYSLQVQAPRLIELLRSVTVDLGAHSSSVQKISGQ